jgi:hypothetical protein
LAPVQTPPTQVSVSVQALPSLHGAPFVFAGFVHAPEAGSQVPATWHWSDAVHVMRLPLMHVPPSHMSLNVQGLPSLHETPFAGVCTQPVAGLQLSVVQGFPSSHEMAALRQTPPVHMPSATWHMSVGEQVAPSAFWQLPVALQALQASHPLLLQQKPSVQKSPATH